jgi:uncharacterized protein involved in copper resistance
MHKTILNCNPLTMSAKDKNLSTSPMDDAKEMLTNMSNFMNETKEMMEISHPDNDENRMSDKEMKEIVRIIQMLDQHELMKNPDKLLENINALNDIFTRIRKRVYK